MGKYTNNAPGARGINLKGGGTRYLAPGETAEIDDGDVEGVHGDIDVGEPDDDGLASMKVADLKKLASDEDVDLGDATTKADIISAIELAREATA